MALLRLIPLVSNGVLIEVNSVFGLMPANITDNVIVKRIDDKSRNGYEVYGTRGASTALVLIAKVPPGKHVEVHG